MPPILKGQRGLLPEVHLTKLLEANKLKVLL